MASSPDMGTEMLMREANDWAVAHGLLMAHKTADGQFEHAPISLEATPYPQQQYIRAVQLAPVFNTLVENISQQPEWLLETLAPVEGHDKFTSQLLDLMRDVMKSGGEKQHLHLGMHRSDYMLHQPPTAEGEATPPMGLLQVELNTIASSFGSLSERVTGLHRHLLSRCAPAVSGTIPANDSLQGLARALATAHTEYLKLRPSPSRGTQVEAVVLFVVQPGERNVMDQRMLEYKLANDHSVRVIRATLAEISERATTRADLGATVVAAKQVVGSSAGAAGAGGGGGGAGASAGGDNAADDEAPVPTAEANPGANSGKGRVPVLYYDDHEVSVVYFRAGYTPNDYPTEKEWAARALVEHSFSIKCPCISYHLAGTKKVQQALAKAGELERFLKHPSDIESVRGVFAGLWSLEPGDPDGMAEVAKAAADPAKYVLKPQREGGGNNYFGDELVQNLKSMNPDELASHILMEKICPPAVSGTLMRSLVSTSGECICELGVYGIYVGHGPSASLNESAGHLLRKKILGTDEGGVAAGYAYLSSPLLCDDDALEGHGPAAERDHSHHKSKRSRRA